GEALPERLVVSGLAVEHGAHRLGRALLGQEFARGVAHLLLVVGEIEVHGAALALLMRFARRMGRAKRNPSYDQFKMIPSSFAGTTASYRGAMRIAPSRRMVSPLSIAF